MSAVLYAGIAAAGVATHLTYFHHGEHHYYPERFVQALLLALVAISATSKYQGSQWLTAVAVSFRSVGVYLLGLITSLLTYRLLFNPLNRFPGPFPDRITTFSRVSRYLKRKEYAVLLKLHRKYGQFVRVGPNDMSITHPDGIHVVMGAHSTCVKSPWYDIEHPRKNLHLLRYRPEHDQQRRAWAPAFSDKALRGYEHRIEAINSLLVQQLHTLSGRPVNVTKWFKLFAFDVMGDLAFGKSYNMLVSAEQRWLIDILNEGMDILGLKLPVWFIRLLLCIPGAGAEIKGFNKYCDSQLNERLKIGEMEHPDVMATLIDAQAKEPNLAALQLDAKLLIVAGSDTTSYTLVSLFYYLTRIPTLVSRLRDELGPLTPNGIISNQRIQDARLLNGCINEALRLHPANASGAERTTPPGGVTIGGIFISGGVNIQIPSYVMGRDESIYTDAETFCPERWSSRQEMVKHKDAFHPFSAGPFGCIGKNLALMEIRLVTAHLITEFNFEFAPSDDGRRMLAEMRDHFTCDAGPLELVFTPRAKA